MTAVAAPAALGAPTLSPLRGGARYWLATYAASVRWRLASLRIFMLVLLSVQIAGGAGFVLGFGLFFRQVPPLAALWVSTGVPVINLVMLGEVFGPQMVALSRTQNTYEYERTVPVPLSADMAAWYTLTLGVGAVTMCASVVTAVLRYHPALSITAAIVPAVMLTVLASTMIGDATGHAIRQPMVTRVVTELTIFAVFGFTPVAIPASQLPGWLAQINHGLPFEHMANVVRAAMTTGLTTGVAVSYAVLAAWCVATGALAWAARVRRD